MLDEFSIADQNYERILTNLCNIVKSLVHFLQRGSVVSFLLESSFVVLFIETKNCKDIWSFKHVDIQMLNFMILNNFYLTLI